jgi:hypothetical protein
MIHLFALAGLALLTALPVSVGVVLFARIRIRTKLKTVLSAPLLFAAGVVLTLIGWGNWPHLPAAWLSQDMIFKCLIGLTIFGMAVGILVRTHRRRP